MGYEPELHRANHVIECNPFWYRRLLAVEESQPLAGLGVMKGLRGHYFLLAPLPWTLVQLTCSEPTKGHW